MNDNERSLNFIKKFLVLSAVLLIICAAVVVIFDPFYHYHGPLPGLKAVLADKEYQVPGTLKNFDYDAVIAGSSVAENNNNHWYDEDFGCTAVKAIRSYGATADLCYYLNIAFENRDVKYVFLNLDPSSLIADTENTTFESVGAPMYLYDKDPVNDIRYVLNKDVIFEKIPYMLANSFMGDYDEGTSYNWAQWKAFDEDTALYHYIQNPEISDMKPEDTYFDICDSNVKLLTDMAKAHPKTQFYIFLPPYSILWWDNLYRDGDTDAYIAMEKRAFNELLKYENIKLYNFQADTDISQNLQNYTDSLHFSPDINRYICDSMAAGKNQVPNETKCKESFEKTYGMAMNATQYVDEHYKDRIKVAVYTE